MGTKTQFKKGNVTVIIVVIVLLIIAGGIFFFVKVGPEGGANLPNDGDDTVQGEETESNLDKAPEFSLKDYDGNTVSSSDFEGKVIVANSWATWCPFCVDELPDFAVLQEEFPDEVVVIAIGRAESLARAKGFTDDLGVTDGLVYLLDPSDSFYSSIGGFSMPETIFVDGDGNIRVHKRGPMPLSEMREHVNGILNTS